MHRRVLRFLPLALVLGLLVTPAPAAASPGETTPGQLYTNDGNTFQAGLNPSTFQGGYQGTCDKGDALSLTGTKSYQDIGKVYWTGTIGELADKGVSYEATDKVVANIWVDTNRNDTFFAWSGNVFSGLGGDDFGGLGTVRDIKGATPVSAANGGSDTWTGVHTLSDLSTKVGPTTKVGIWVGIAGQAPQMGSISSFAGRPLLAEKGCPLGGGLAPNSGPDSASSGPNQVSTFVRGNDNALWYRSWDGIRWSDWKPLDGILTADPGAVSDGDRTDVFVRGADYALWHIGIAGGNVVTQWQKIGGVLTSGPDAASWAKGRFDVFARGTDNALYHLAGNGTSWSGWEGLGGYLTSDPGAVSWGPDRIDIFVRGWDYSAWHFAWNGTAWTGWSSLGGYLTSSPDAASRAPNNLDVSALGPSQTLYHATGNGSTWSGWQPLGGQWTGNPSGVSPRGSGYADYFTRGTDGALYWNTQPLP